MLTTIRGCKHELYKMIVLIGLVIQQNNPLETTRKTLKPLPRYDHLIDLHFNFVEGGQYVWWALHGLPS